MNFIFVKPATGVDLSVNPPEVFTEADFDVKDGKLKHFGGLKRLQELQVVAEYTGPTKTATAPAPVLFAGKPLAAYAGKSDEDLLKMPGVNKTVLKSIRDAEAAAAAANPNL